MVAEKLKDEFPIVGELLGNPATYHYGYKAAKNIGKVGYDQWGIASDAMEKWLKEHPTGQNRIDAQKAKEREKNKKDEYLIQLEKHLEYREQRRKQRMKAYASQTATETKKKKKKKSSLLKNRSKWYVGKRKKRMNAYWIVRQGKAKNKSFYN